MSTGYFTRHTKMALWLGIICLALCPVSIFSLEEDCYIGLQQILLTTEQLVNHNLSSKLKSVPNIYYSGKELNDLGNYELCQASEKTQYVTLYAEEHETYTLGVCGPANCSAESYRNKTIQSKVKEIIKLVTPHISANYSSLAKNHNFEVRDPDGQPPVDYFTYAAFILMAVPFLLMCFATGWVSLQNIFDMNRKKGELDSTEILYTAVADSESQTLLTNYKRALAIQRPKVKTSREKGAKEKFMECWSMQTSAKKLLGLEVSEKHDKNLDFFNGIRFLLCGWIVFGHQMDSRAPLIRNYKERDIMSHNILVDLPIGAYYAVDCFFFLSGFFATFVLYSKLQTMPLSLKTYGSVLFHRVIRILPTYAFVLFLFWRVVGFFGNGPLWSMYLKEAAQCDGRFWQNFLFIDNIMQLTKLDDTGFCLGWSWYLANDMQMFLLSPLLVWLYLHKPSRGVLIICLLILSSVSLNIAYAFIYDGRMGDIFPDASQFGYHTYINPLVRVTPYLFGTLVAFAYRRLRQGNEDMNRIASGMINSGFMSWFSQIAGSMIINVLIFIPGVARNFPHVLPFWFHNVWIGLDKLLLSIGFMLLILPSLLGKDTLLKTFFSSKVFVPLSTLSFSIYLIHPVLIDARTAAQKTVWHACLASIATETLIAIVMSVVGAALVYFVIEAPISNIEALVRSSKSADSSKGTAHEDEESDSLLVANHLAKNKKI